MTIFTWLLTAMSLAGVVLNLHQDRRCFYLWCVTNTSWAAVDLTRGLYAQTAMFIVYLILSIWGLYKWKHKEA